MPSNPVFIIAPVALAAGMLLTAAVSYGGSLPAQPKPTMAKSCTGCHRAEANTLHGYFDNVAFKAKTIQMRIDDSIELIKFDEDEVKVVTTLGKSGDGDALHQTRKGQELKLEYTEKDGVKTAIRIVEKPTVQVSKDMLVTTAELDGLFAGASKKDRFFLFDSRPAERFQEGAIPTAVNLPYPSFDTRIDRLPADKNALIVFYCGGLTCSLSPASAAKAKQLGYDKVKVYREGIPGWSEKHYTVLSAQSLQEAWIGAGTPLVLLDVRGAKEAAKGFIKGAVSFPAARAAKLVKGLPEKERNPPIVVYDAKDGKKAEQVARLLLQEGYGEVKVLTGGFAAWKSGGYLSSVGKLNAKAGYLPKPRIGEIDPAQFERFAAALPADTVIIDVRNPDEVKNGMLKNAINIPTEEIKARMAEIPKDKLIIVQCTTGVRAEMAYHALKELGYDRVKFVNAKIQFEKNGAYTITAN